MTEPTLAHDLLGPARYTRTEVAAAAQVDLAVADRLWTAMGFPIARDDAVVYTEADLAALRRAAELIGGGSYDPQILIGLARAMGQNLSRLAQTHAQLLAAHPEAAGEEQAVLSVSAIAELVDYVWRRHLHAALDGAADAPGSTASGVQKLLVVGFADLDGYTRLSRRLEATELSALVDSFEDITSTVVTQGGGRVVKTAGDDVLFTCIDPVAAVLIGLDIVDRITEQPDLPGVSVGLAYGSVLLRLGDVFGPVVNLASRLTGVARPGTVLSDREVADAIVGSTAVRARTLRRRAVGGYGHLAAYRLDRVKD
ncbi:MAG: adenylate cyclase regulatory domain-containing protein [Mycobacteriales bacterium]